MSHTLFSNNTSVANCLRSYLFLLLCAACSFCFYLFSPNLSADEREDLNRVIKQLESLNKQLQGFQREQSDLQEKIRDQELELSTLHKQIFETDEQISAGNNKLETLNQQRETLQKRLKQQEIAMKQDLVAMYKNGSEEPLKMLLNQEDPSRLSRNLTYYQYIAAARSENIQAFQSTLEELATNQERIDQENRHLENLVAGLKVQEAELNQSLSRRASLLTRLAEQILSAEQEIAQSRENANRLEQLIRDAAQAVADLTPPESYRPFAELRGKFKWPVTGRIIHQYNSSRKGDLRWQGVVLNAKEGAVVKSLHYGHVVFADYMRGYGLLVIIDHEDGYMTLYGHNQSLFVELGDWITPEDQIALVGNSGGLGQSGLYFEVRQNGNPINPNRWCSNK